MGCWRLVSVHIMNNRCVLYMYKKMNPFFPSNIFAASLSLSLARYWVFDGRKFNTTEKFPKSHRIHGCLRRHINYTIITESKQNTCSCLKQYITQYRICTRAQHCNKDKCQRDAIDVRNRHILPVCLAICYHKTKILIILTINFEYFEPDTNGKRLTRERTMKW